MYEIHCTCESLLLQAQMSKTDSVEQLIANINSCEAKLRKLNPSIQWIFFEPDVVDRFKSLSP